jgi:hypothetical protein
MINLLVNVKNYRGTLLLARLKLKAKTSRKLPTNRDKFGNFLVKLPPVDIAAEAEATPTIARALVARSAISGPPKPTADPALASANIGSVLFARLGT